MHDFSSKPHYELLDGLRGVAAVMVVLFHLFECFSWSPVPKGYLFVDFFFALSGFVIGYAYDDRWKKGLTMGSFFRRRLIRLHPMVLIGAGIGSVCFVIQGCVRWDGTSVATSMVMWALLLNLFLLPLPVGTDVDVRGNGEMYPLNGPHWSLFFEYIGNALYALLLRRLSTRWLTIVATITSILLASIALRDGYLGVGWSMVDNGFPAGLVRMLAPYSIGILMARMFRPMRVHHAFWLCSLVLVSVGCLPLLFTDLPLWANGLYDVVCVVVVFPLLIWTGASEISARMGTLRIGKLLGDVSYPLYAVHYPLMYLFYAHIGFDGNLVPIEKLREVWPVAIALPMVCFLIGWLCLRLYDIPVRSWLTRTWK